MSLNNEKRDRAYKVGGKVTRERIEKEAPLDGEALPLLEASDILVVKGQYDRVEKVLEALELPFTAIEPGQFGQVPLSTWHWSFPIGSLDSRMVSRCSMVLRKA